jgi:hypothetical protein
MARTMMLRMGFAGALLAGCIAAASPSHAVDVVNSDRVARDIVVNDSDGESKALTLQPDAKIANVCQSCVILAGNSSVEANGNDLVKITKSNIAISAKH